METSNAHGSSSNGGEGPDMMSLAVNIPPSPGDSAETEAFYKRTHTPSQLDKRSTVEGSLSCSTVSDSSLQHHFMSAKDQDLPTMTPIFLYNPDGSYAEGVPPGYKDKTPPLTPRLASAIIDDFPLAGDLDVRQLVDELTSVYTRHERLFVCLLLMELVIELTFNILYVYYSSFSVREVAMVYHSLSAHTLWSVFWCSLGVEIAYVVAYYSLGCYALLSHKPTAFKMFAQVALFGVLCQVMLAYMNKFNLLIFVLRLMSYIYAKFLRNLLRSMSILTPPGFALPVGSFFSGEFNV